jgi:predicted Abi (CAAX) family protease
LELHHHLSEQTLAAWRTALTRRWELEIAGQRLYTRIQRQMLDQFGSDSPELQAVAPVRKSQGITPVDLLADLRRTLASLRLLSATHALLGGEVAELETVCSDLGDAIALTHDLQQKRRNAMIDQRLAQDIYQRVRYETQFWLSKHLDALVLRNGRTAEYSEYAEVTCT